MQTIQNTENMAKARANADRALYEKAIQRFGKTIESVRGQMPKYLAVAHVLRVNKTLVEQPIPRGQSQGFLMANFTQAKDAGLVLDDMRSTLKCAYAWCRSLNSIARNTYTGNENLFLVPGVDFWQCVYLNDAIGFTAFKSIWNAASKSAGSCYPALLQVVKDLYTPPPGWSLTKIQKTVLVDCEYVKELWLKKGPAVSEGFGEEPYLDSRKASMIFGEKT